MKYWKRRCIILLLLVAGMSATNPVTADATEEETCGEHAKIVKNLEENHQEQREGMGATNSGGLVEVFAGKNSWTLVLKHPKGQACIIASGEGWQNLGRRKQQSRCFKAKVKETYKTPVLTVRNCKKDAMQ